MYFKDTSDSYDTYWYGSYDNGYSVYNPGNTMALRFEGYYDDLGFQIVYYQADPGK